MQAVALAAVSFALPNEIVVAIPVRDGCPRVVRTGRSRGVRPRAPVIAGTRRQQRNPFLRGAGKTQIRRAEIRTDGEEEIVSGEVHVAAACLDPELGEAGIDIEIALGDAVAEQVEHFELPGVVEEQIRARAKIAECSEVGALAVDDEALAVGQAELRRRLMPEFFLRTARAARFRRLQFARLEMLGDPDFKA